MESHFAQCVNFSALIDYVAVCYGIGVCVTKCCTGVNAMLRLLSSGYVC